MKLGVQSRLLIAGLVIAAGVWGYRSFTEQQRLGLLAAEAQVEEEFYQALKQNVTIEFGREVTLREWLAEFTRQTGVEVEAEQETYSGGYDPFGDGAPGPVRKIDIVLSLDLASRPAHEVLDRLATAQNKVWMLRSDGVVELDYSFDSNEEPRTLRHYSAAHSGLIPQAELLLLLQTYVDTGEWQEHRRTAFATPNGFCILQPARGHLRTERFLADLAVACEQLRRVSPSTPAGDPGWNPVPIGCDAESEFQLQAWPVADLLDGSGSAAPATRLIEVLTKTQNRIPFDGDANAEGFSPVAGGKLLLFSNTPAEQRSLGRLLTALRKVKSGAAQHATAELEQLPQDRAHELATRLNAPLEFEYRGVVESDRRRDIYRRGGLVLPIRSDQKAVHETPLWCYLPPAPLGENLYRLIGDIESDLILLDGVSLGDAALSRYHNLAEYDPYLLARTVFDVRPWISSPDDENDLIDLLGQLTEYPFSSGDLESCCYRGLVIVQCHPQLIPRVNDLVNRLRDFLVPRQNRQWNGRNLAGADLCKSLELFTPTAAEARRAAQNAEINRKLQEPVTVTIWNQRLGDALLAIAREQQLPLIAISRPTPFDPLTKIVNYAAQNKPLGQVLQDLIGSPEHYKWLVNHGRLTVVESYVGGSEPVNFFYDVEDLVVPRGKFQPGQLVRTLMQPLQGNDLQKSGEWSFQNWTSTQFGFYFGKILQLHSRPELPNRERVEQTLRQLRSGELKALPVQAGDEDFNIPNYPPYSTGSIPVVGARETGGLSR